MEQREDRLVFASQPCSCQLICPIDAAAAAAGNDDDGDDDDVVMMMMPSLTAQPASSLPSWTTAPLLSRKPPGLRGRTGTTRAPQLVHWVTVGCQTHPPSERQLHWECSDFRGIQL